MSIACTIFSRCRAMPPRRRPSEQPAPTTSTRTFGQPRHSPPRRPDLVRQHISTSLSIVAQRSTHQPTPPAAQPAPRPCLTSHAPREPEPSTTYSRQVATPPADFLPDDAVQTADRLQSSQSLSQQLACSPPPIIIFYQCGLPASKDPPKTFLPSSAQAFTLTTTSESTYCIVVRARR